MTRSLAGTFLSLLLLIGAKGCDGWIQAERPDAWLNRYGLYVSADIGTVQTERLPVLSTRSPTDPYGPVGWGSPPPVASGGNEGPPPAVGPLRAATPVDGRGATAVA